MENKSLFEETIDEFNQEQNAFENIINSDNEFNLVIAIMPDEYLINLYNYLLKIEKKESFMLGEDGFSERLFMIRTRLAKLESIPEIADYNFSKLSKEEQDSVREGVETVKGKQKVHKMGPLTRRIYDRIHKKKN